MGYIPAPEIEKPCQTCGAKFGTRHSAKKYCSSECQVLFVRKVAQAKRDAERVKKQEAWKTTCLFCGKVFTKKTLHSRFCSAACGSFDRNTGQDFSKDYYVNFILGAIVMEEIKNTGRKVEVDRGELKRLRGYEQVIKDFLAQVAARGVDPTLRKLVAENRKLKTLVGNDLDELVASEDDND